MAAKTNLTPAISQQLLVISYIDMKHTDVHTGLSCEYIDPKELKFGVIKTLTRTKMGSEISWKLQIHSSDGSAEEPRAALCISEKENRRMSTTVTLGASMCNTNDSIIKCTNTFISSSLL